VTAAPSGTIWPLEPHTKVKHAILSEYLKAWFPILGKYNGKVVYIDGFAGPGRYSEEEPGSPLVALNIARNARFPGKIVFLFIEKDAKRLQNLKNEIGNIPWPDTFDISTAVGSFADNLSGILANLKSKNLKPAPIFAFIDPFGFKDIPFDLIRQLLSYERCEIFINFMVDSINRWIAHPKEEIRSHIHTLLGSDKLNSILNAEDRIKALRDLYEEQLKTAAKFVLSFKMRNKKERTQYYLFFASNNRMGHIKMKESMWKIDAEGEYWFSDAKISQTNSLFQDFTQNMKQEKMNDDLFSQIWDQFKSRSNVPCSSIREFVEDKSIYLKKQMNQALSWAEGAGKIIVCKEKTDGSKRRKNTFPDNVLIDFKEG